MPDRLDALRTIETSGGDVFTHKNGGDTIIETVAGSDTTKLKDDDNKKVISIKKK